MSRRPAIIGRILDYLDKARYSEHDPWLADDLYIARQAVANAATDVRDPWGFAFWSYFGKTYRKALIAWAERDRQNQKALERCVAPQPMFNLYVTALAEISLPPKKPSSSVTRVDVEADRSAMPQRRTL